MSERLSSTTRPWIIDVLLGGLAGGFLGAVVAVNLVINLGPESGYQSTITDVYEHNAVLGIATILTLLLGPLAGIAVARRQRRQQL